jgi:4-amino-4-deoxy-L-arabinose transferase-like glycosyltransferase
MNTEQFSSAGQLKDPQRNLRLLRAVIWVVTICAGFVQAWATRFWIEGDGNNYLDVASAYLHRDWSHIVNGYWSPLFSWLIALCLGVFHSSRYWDSTLLHLLDLAGLILSLFSFEFFFRAFFRMHIQLSASENAEAPLSELGWWTLGYAIFLSTSLLVLTVTNTTPDVWVAVFTYFIAGLVVRIAYHRGGWHLFALLGLALGCAYLTKTFYFPMSFVFLLTAWFAAGNPRKTFGQAVIGLLAFLLVAGPWIVVLSRAKNRLTFGDVGTVAFTRFYDRPWHPFFWQGENGTGIPKHPVRQLLAKPPRLFEFATPVGGSYPPSYDSTYWMDGLRPHFRLSSLLKVLRQSAGTFFQIWTLQLEYSLAILILFFLLPVKADWLLLLRKQFYLWVPPLIACLNYTIVLVEPRYVAPFLLLLWVAAFASFLGLKSEVPRRFAQALVLALLIMTGVRLAKSTTSDLLAIFAGQKNVYWQVAERLWGLGLLPGSRVALLSSSPGAHWARLAGVKIVAEVPLGDEPMFWAADPVEKHKVLQAIASTGARFVVTKDPPMCAVAEGWIPLGVTGFYAYRLPSATQPGAAP